MVELLILAKFHFICVCSFANTCRVDAPSGSISVHRPKSGYSSVKWGWGSVKKVIFFN